MRTSGLQILAASVLDNSLSFLYLFPENDEVVGG